MQRDTKDILSGILILIAILALYWLGLAIQEPPADNFPSIYLP